MAKKTIFSDFLDLLMDEEINVQESSFENLMKLCDSMDAETKIAVLIPTWRRICSEESQKLPKLSLKTAELFGQFLWKTKSRGKALFSFLTGLFLDELSDSDKQAFLSFYQSASISSDISIRRLCAYNFPVFHY